MLPDQLVGVFVGLDDGLEQELADTAVNGSRVIEPEDGREAPGRKRRFLDGLSFLAEDTRDVGHEPMRGVHGVGARLDRFLEEVGARLFVADKLGPRA